uniref:Uncharacterized protein n=1 Tax=Opuntia streptacantha TaxID=393608 RepID=A0A7C9CVA1_OPUST
MMIPMATPMGLEMAKANAYAAQDRKGRSGIILRRAIAMAMAAKILCREIVQRAFQASDAVFETPIAMPSKTEWKHRAAMRRMVSPRELAVASSFALAKWCMFVPLHACISIPT